MRLWQLISPTLPVGAFSYSQGLEQALESGAVAGEAGVREWLGGLLRHALAYVDMPIVLRVERAWRAGDADAVRRWSRELDAARETAELKLEDSTMGGALKQLLASLGAAAPAHDVGFASAFAIAAAEWSIAPEDACAGYAWAWCEAQVAAAVKLVPLGHTAGQRLLLALGGEIAAAVETALALADDDIGQSLPGFALASALHETQYTRLFRS
jgi:urease accessory protein